VTLVISFFVALFPSSFLHFFLIFPSRSKILNKHPNLEKFLYIIFIIVFPLVFINNSIKAFLIKEIINQNFIETTIVLLLVCVIITGIAIFFNSYKKAPSRDMRNRYKIIFGGLLIGFIPLIILELIEKFYPYSAIRITLQYSIFTFIAVPLSFAYSILRYKVIDVKFIIRKGLKHSFISFGIGEGFGLLEFIPFVIIIYLFSTSGITLINVGITVIITVFEFLIRKYRLKTKALNLIDKKFYRERYDAVSILTELSQELNSVHELRQLQEIIVTKIEKSFHPRTISFFIPDTGRNNYLLTLPAESGKNLSFSEDSVFIQKLIDIKQPFIIYPDNPGDSYAALFKEYITILKSLSANVLVPFFSGNRLVGIMVLGEKLSEEPYVRDDITLLSALSSQIATSIENAFLLEELASKKLIERELEIAKGVQKALLPQKFPDMEKLEIWGECHPAFEVGGDYFDIFRIDDRNIGIVIADVSGKGISASLLMSNLQASLKAYTRLTTNIEEILYNINNHLVEYSSPSQFITLFLGIFNTTNSTLTFCNAGHNVPYIFKKTGDVKELEKGGIILGALKDFKYIKKSVILEQGDLLLAYTDGIIEVMNRKGEEFGEEKVIEIVKNHYKSNPQEICSILIRETTAFSGEKGYIDDKTIVMVRV